jgi:membrane protease YdiL (CAAX protease family)
MVPMTKSISNFAKNHRWLIFLSHQALIFLTAIVFLTSVRKLTGRNIHLGQDPVGLIDGTALVALSVGVIFFTNVLYRWVRGRNATPLGISLSLRRFVDLIVGLLIGFSLIILPYLIALVTGTATIHDRITARFDNLTTARIIAVAFFFLLLQSVTEETANRAFPMRLWEDRPLWFRILIPSFFFAAIHLAGEGFSFERIGILLMAGVTQSFAYALTGNIWLATGLHTGANLASFFPTGLWHAGAIVALVGHVRIPNLLMVMIMLVMLGSIYILSSVRARRQSKAEVSVST